MKRKKPEPPVLKVTQEQVETMLQRAKALLSSEDYAIIKALVDKDAMLTDLLKQQGTRLNRLRRLFGIRGSEKSKDVLPPQGDGTVQGNSKTKPENKDLNASDSDRAKHPEGSSSANSSTATDTPSKTAESNPSKTEKQKTEGHGRIPASAYGQAEHIKVAHETLKVKDRCPRCASGNLYRLKEPAPILHIVGNAPLVARCYDCERLRCNTCGHIFTAQPPKEAQGGKYDESAVAMLALLHYSMGMPLYRLAQLQNNLQTPVPESTQWDLLNEHVPLLQPVYDLLLHLAAQG